jgi:hypothetical protein
MHASGGITASALSETNRPGAAAGLHDDNRAFHMLGVRHRHKPADHVSFGGDCQLQRQRHGARQVKRGAGSVQRGLVAVQNHGGDTAAPPRLVKLVKLHACTSSEKFISWCVRDRESVRNMEYGVVRYY